MIVFYLFFVNFINNTIYFDHITQHLPLAVLYHVPLSTSYAIVIVVFSKAMSSIVAVLIHMGVEPFDSGGRFM